MNKPDLFEEHIKKAVENYEAPFSTEAWNQIENQIPGHSISVFSGLKNWIYGAVAVAAVATGIWFFTNDSIPAINEPIKNQAVDKTIVKESMGTDSKTDEVNQTTITEDKLPEKNIEQPVKAIDKRKEENAVEEIISGSESNKETEAVKAVVSVNNSKTDIPEELNKNDNQNNPVVREEEEEESLVVNWIISKDELCQDEELMVSINNVNEPVELIWDFGDGNFSTEPKVFHRYTTPGLYTIKLKANSLISDNKVYREKKYIEVRANPQPEFIIEPSDNMAMLPEVEFSNQTKYFSHFQWLFENEKIEDVNTVDRLYRYKGDYRIGLKVVNQFGCSDTLFRELHIDEDYKLLAPSAFTPNDDGVNDFFMPEALLYLNKKFTMQVISKNGKVVFETKNVESPWNGKMNNSGNLLKNGPYAWTVKFDDGAVYSGTVLLMTD